MTSIRHEGPLLLLGDRPELLCTLLGIALPEGASVSVGNADFTQAVPLERRADAVVMIEQDGAITSAFVVEIQLAMKDDKRFAWPLYVASLHARLRCTSTLVVLALDDDVAAWARAPIATMQPATPLAPVAIGPADIPRVMSPEDEARMPELAVLSALAHGNETDGAVIAANAIGAVAQLDDPHSKSYIDLIYSSLGDVARAALEAFMSLGKYEYQSDFAKKYVAEGVARGRVEAFRKALCATMTARRLGPSVESQDRIDACDEPTTLERWVLRAAVADTEADVFADE